MLVDDLVSRGVSEPYRMFTSRAEHRLLLREDNADQRLTPVGRDLGLVDDERMAFFERKMATIETERARLGGILIRPADKDAASHGISRESHALELLRRPDFDYARVAGLGAVGRGEFVESETEEFARQVQLDLDVTAKYHGYIERQQREIDKQANQENLSLPQDLDYDDVIGLSNEARQRLTSARPETLGQASRLEGVTPSTISLLMIHLRKGRLKATG